MNFSRVNSCQKLIDNYICIWFVFCVHPLKLKLYLPPLGFHFLFSSLPNYFFPFLLIHSFEEKLFTVKKSQSIILINWSVGSQTHQIQDSPAHKSSSLHQIITIILELLMVLCIIDYMSHQHYRAFDHVNSHWCHYILIHW